MFMFPIAVAVIYKVLTSLLCSLFYTTRGSMVMAAWLMSMLCTRAIAIGVQMHVKGRVMWAGLRCNHTLCA